MIWPNDFINKIICGDCLEVMKDIPDNSIDAVITDPPFGIGFNKYNGNKDVANDPQQYYKWIFPVYKEILRIAKLGGFIAIWQPNLYHRYFWEWYGNDIRIYAGCKNFVQLRKTPINYGYDPIVMKYTDWNNPLKPTKPKRNLDFFVSNTAKFVTETTSLARKHPCPRPIDQTIEIIRNFTISNGIVLDPFIGSGTTALACKMENRSFIGIDISSEYCEIARQRIANEQSNTDIELD